MDVVVQELSGIGGLVGPKELTVTIFFAEFVLTLVVSSIWPSLLTFAMLLVINPLTFVLGTICMGVLTKAMGFVILPVPVIDVAVSVDESSSTIGHVSLPVALVDGAIAPNLHSFAVSLICVHVPLTRILSTITQSLSIPILKPNTLIYTLLILIQCILERWQRIPDAHDIFALPLQLFRVHFDLHRASHHPRVDLEAIGFVDLPPGQKASHLGLHFDDYPDGESAKLPSSVGIEFPLANDVPQICIITSATLLGFTTATICTHLL